MSSDQLQLLVLPSSQAMESKEKDSKLEIRYGKKRNFIQVVASEFFDFNFMLIQGTVKIKSQKLE
jgi:hypothetical protein